MAEYVKISPVTRLEGHLGVTTRVNDSKVAAAYSHGEMFRGLEKILIGRDPRDAPVITSRTCGVCHFIHRHTSLRNIETAAGFTFPYSQAADATYGGSNELVTGGISVNHVPGSLYTSGTDDRWHGPQRNKSGTGVPGTGTKMPWAAQMSRNIVHLVTYVYSHAAHTIALAAPDYKYYIDKFVQDANDGNLSSPWSGLVAASNAYIDGSDVGSGSFFDNFYKEAVVAQRILHEILGFLGGKVPHQQSAIPGGFSRSYKGQLNLGDTSNTDMDAIAILASKFIGLGGQDPEGKSTGTGRFPLLDLTGGGGLGSRSTLVNSYNDAGSTVDNSWIVKRVALFTLALAWACVQTDAGNWGVGSGNFVCAGTFDMIDTSDTNPTAWEVIGDQYFRGGVYLVDNTSGGGASRLKLDVTQASPDSGWMTIYEDIASGKYPYPDPVTELPKCGGWPGVTETHPLVGNYDFIQSDGTKRNVYTWYKATRVYDGTKGYNVESGPLARLVVNGVDPNLNLLSEGTGLRGYLYTSSWKSSTANRLIGRLQDTLLLIDMLIGTNYSGENHESGNLVDPTDSSGNTYANDGYLKDIAANGCWLGRLNEALAWLDTNLGGAAVPASLLYVEKDWENLDGEGAAMWDAPRGITCHFSQVKNGLLTQYQHIAGTTWNGNGRDEWGNPGPFEWSLMNLQKEDADYAEYVDPKYEVDATDAGSGKYVITLRDVSGTDLTDSNPVAERTIKIRYQLKQTTGWTYAIDEPKHEQGSEEGQIVGDALKGSSKIYYEGTNAGKIVLEFKYHYDYGYDYVDSIEVVRFGYAGDEAVPTPYAWTETGDAGYGYGYESNSSYPNPINILRTIRSYDPCLACSIQVVDKEGREGKYEAVPVAGWDPK